MGCSVKTRCQARNCNTMHTACEMTLTILESQHRALLEF